MRQVAHQAGAYPSFCSMKQLGVFLLPPGWDASSSLGYCPFSSPAPLCTPGWREELRQLKCLVQEHNTNTMPPARAQIWTARFRVELTNHDTIAPPQ